MRLTKQTEKENKEKQKMKHKKLWVTTAVILATAMFITGGLAQGFWFIFVEEPFDPTNYSWEDDWEVKEMVDFMEATLTIRGCSYQTQVHPVELVIQNVATVSNYYAISFAYSAQWYVDEANQETIIQGSYDGALGIGETITDTTTFQPSVIGVGVIKLTVIDIEWVQGESITWTTEVVDNTAGMVEVTDFTVDNINSGVTGTVSFKAGYTSPEGTFVLAYTVEIVELALTLADVTGEILTGGQPATAYEHTFGPLPSGGSLTMRITVMGKQGQAMHTTMQSLIFPFFCSVNGNGKATERKLIDKWVDLNQKQEKLKTERNWFRLRSQAAKSIFLHSQAKDTGRPCSSEGQIEGQVMSETRSETITKRFLAKKSDGTQKLVTIRYDRAELTQHIYLRRSD